MTRPRRTFLTTAAIALCAVTVSAQLSTTDQAAIQAYRSAIALAESGRAAMRGIETAFAAISPLRDALMLGRHGNYTLESLPDADFRRLEQALPGLSIGREEIVFVNPDVDYFVKLAASRGDEVDRAFFSALKATRPNSVMSVYIEQQTDYSGCTRFGSLSLVGTYRAWSEFQQRFPGRYAEGAKEELTSVSRELTDSTCACGDAASVDQELQQFLKDFPASSIMPQIDARLKALRAGQSRIRMTCVSGYAAGR